MSAVAPTTPMMDFELPKRKRKRTRSRKNKSGAGAEEGEEEEESSGLAQTPSGQPTAPAQSIEQKPSGSALPERQAEKKSEQTHDTENAADSKKDDDAEEDDEDDTAEAGGKKKRKRNRKRSKKGGQGDGDGAEPVSGSQPSTSRPPINIVPHQGLEEELKATGVPDPEKDAEIPEGSKKAALTYAYTHHTARTSWKFQKAREAWLLRHLLSAPLGESESLPQAATQTRTDTISGEESSSTAPPAVDNNIPDSYLPLVVNYLGTMQGKSKQRLVDELKGFVAQSRTLPEEKEKNVKETTATSDAAATSTTASKSVSFADVADEQNRKEETGVDETAERKVREQVRWKGARAEKVLHWFGVTL